MNSRLINGWKTFKFVCKCDMNSSYIKTISIRIKIKLTETHDNKDKKIHKNIIEQYKNVRK
jgi:hypothetical protein